MKFNYLNFAIIEGMCPCGLMDKASPSGLERWEAKIEGSSPFKDVFIFFFPLNFPFSILFTLEKTKTLQKN